MVRQLLDLGVAREYPATPTRPALLNAIRLDLAVEAVKAGVFNLVVGSGPVVGARLSAHPDVDFVSFTCRPTQWAMYESPGEAVELANDTPYGSLCRGAGTEHERRGRRCQEDPGRPGLRQRGPG
ncbi:MAG TPA: aldehyde dehydrogenase family protein [Trebonia sp.]